MMSVITNFVMGLVLGKIVFGVISVLVFLAIVSYFCKAMGIEVPILIEVSNYMMTFFETIKDWFAQFIK